MEDCQLIHEYVMQNSEGAFNALVKRHLSLVHSAALRQVHDPQLAEDVTQAVFILLARKAGSFRRDVVLPGWLYRTTRFVAARALRSEQRRQRREQEAFQMQQISSPDDTWRRVAPFLDEAMEQLGETDRNAVILRFFQEERLQKVGDMLGMSEEAARKRIARAVEKLRAFFGRRGFTISGAVLAAVLVKHSAEAVPEALGSTIASAALAKSAAATLPILVKETLSAWRWAKVKLAVGVGTFGIIASLLLMSELASTPQRSASVSIGNVGTQSLSLPVASSAGGLTVDAPVSKDDTFYFEFQAVDAETGMGVAGARVLTLIAQDREHIELHTNLVTDSEGRCRVPISSSNLPMLVVGVVADGYEEKCVVLGDRTRSGLPIQTQYVLKLPHGSRIGGVVQDESGNAVAGADILVQFNGTGDSDTREFQRERPGFPADDLALAKTDLAGHWTFGSAPATNGDFGIEVTYSDYPKASFQTDADEVNYIEPHRLKLSDLHAGNAVLVLKSGLTLRGMVTDEKQNPVVSAKVSVGEYLVRTKPVISTAADGSFVLNNLSPGRNYVTVMAEGFAPERSEVEVSTNTSPLAIRLKAGALLRLRVVDETGGGVGHADIRLQAWRGNNTLDWGGYTDDGGRIEWTSAPHDQMDFFAGKEGFFYSRNNLALADGEEHTITLHRQLTVSGIVTDAGTKQPIAGFKAIPGSEPQYWERSNLAHGTNGQFILTFDEYRMPFQVRIEADGYEPAISRPLGSSVTNATYNVELKRQNPQNAVHGVVQLPDGSPAAGAHVALCTAESGVILGRTKFLNQNHAIVTDTDAEGRFSFSPDPNPQIAVAVNEQGFGRAQVNGTNGAVTIQVQPWGQIEGKLKLRTKSNADQAIALLDTPGPLNRGAVRLDLGAFSTKTDEQGNFVFDQVPPGDFDLYLVPGPGIPFSHQTPVEVPGGTAVRVQIGGTGRQIIGRFVLSDSSRVVNWPAQFRFPNLGTKLPPFPIPPGLKGKDAQKWQEEFWQSDEGQARGRASRRYPVEIATDGSFTVDDIPPGTYELSARLFDSAFDPTHPGAFGTMLGSVRQEVVVPQAADEQSIEPFNIGTVTVTIR